VQKIRGIYEREQGSGLWWIRYTDADGQKRREKAGSSSNAKKLLEKRHTAVLEGKKLPERGRGMVSFTTLCDDALIHSRSENSAQHTYDLECRLKVLKESFGSRPAANIRRKEIVQWLDEQAEEREWSPATRNRWQAGFSLVYRVAIESDLIDKNPAALIRRKTEHNEQVRFLSDDEEAKLVAAIQKLFPEFLPHFLLSVHTGMRMTEQYSLRWNQVSFERKQVYLPKTKNGDTRVIPLNATALSAFEQLRAGVRSGVRSGDPVFPSDRVEEGGALQGSRGWFSTAVEEAKIEHYWWHANRHTFASKLVMAGVDLLTVATLLGHRTLQMVKRYAHLAPDHQADAVARLVSRNQKDTPADTDGSGAKSRRKSSRVKSLNSGG
jgi:site-specific recombinase XerD